MFLNVYFLFTACAQNCASCETSGPTRCDICIKSTISTETSYARKSDGSGCVG